MSPAKPSSDDEADEVPGLEGASTLKVSIPRSLLLRLHTHKVLTGEPISATVERAVGVYFTDRAAPVTAPPPAVPDPARPASPPVVLDVDDEPAIREVVRRLLASRFPEAEVHLAADARAGLRILASHRVDVVLTDYRLPGLDGLAFLAEARRVAPGARRILMTAYGDYAIAAAALNVERVTCLLGKPFEPDVLVAAVKEAARF